MDKKSLIPKVLDKKIVRDYTYIVMFLLISSFFAFFAVRPALKIAVSLNKESKELEQINRKYENNILKVVKLQEVMQVIRDKKYLLDEAIPNRPSSDRFVDQVVNVFNGQGLVVKKFSMKPIVLAEKSNNKDLQRISIDIEAIGDYQMLQRAMTEILNQRRVKTMKSFSVKRDEESASASASLLVQMDLEGYFLK